jgi:hypothetical protein
MVRGTGTLLTLPLVNDTIDMATFHIGKRHFEKFFTKFVKNSCIGATIVGRVRLNAVKQQLEHQLKESILNLIKRNSVAMILTVAGALAAGVSQPAMAQTTVAPAGTTAVARTASTIPDARYLIELKDISLSDALETIFQTAGNPSHTINEAAKSVYVTSIAFDNTAWDAGVRLLATQNNFTVTRNAEGTYNIQPRGSNQFGQGGMNGAGGRQNRRNRGAGAGGAGTANPFGGGAANPFGNFGG